MLAGLATFSLRRQDQSAPTGAARSSPTALSAPTPISEEDWRARLTSAIGGADRLTRVAVTSEVIAVQWSIAQFSSSSIRNDGMRRDVASILQAVQASRVSYGRVALRGTYRFEDGVEEAQVLEATYTKATIDRIDFSAADPGEVLRRADTLAMDGRFAL